jgi:hypothetical protein
MSTQKQMEANRRNALKSTGPRTPEGKAKVAQNAVKHGILSKLTILPEVESQDEWEAHVSRVLDDLQPVGYLEQVLAEDIAATLWRLARARRYEAEAAAVEWEDAEERLAKEELGWGRDKAREVSPLGEATGRVRAAQERLALLEKLPGMPEDEPVPDGVSLMLEIIREADVNCDDPNGPLPGLPGLPDGAYIVDADWTAGMVRADWRKIAEFRQWSHEEWLDRLTSEARGALDEAESELESLRHKLDQRRRMSILPREHDLARVTRYESHLERALYKALHELQRLQAARQGRLVAAPVALDVDVSGSGSVE